VTGHVKWLFSAVMRSIPPDFSFSEHRKPGLFGLDKYLGWVAPRFSVTWASSRFIWRISASLPASRNTKLH